MVAFYLLGNVFIFAPAIWRYSQDCRALTRYDWNEATGQPRPVEEVETAANKATLGLEHVCLNTLFTDHGREHSIHPEYTYQSTKRIKSGPPKRAAAPKSCKEMI